MSALQEKDSRVESFQEEEKPHWSPSFIYIMIGELESYLEVDKKSWNKSTTTPVKMESYADEALGALR